MAQHVVFLFFLSFFFFSVEYHLLKAQNIGRDTPAEACRKACSKIGLGLMPLDNIGLQISDIRKLPHYSAYYLLVTDGMEKFSSNTGISRVLSTPKGGGLKLGIQFRKSGRRAQNITGDYCFKITSIAPWYMSTDCSDSSVRDRCVCKRGESWYTPIECESDR